MPWRGTAKQKTTSAVDFVFGDEAGRPVTREGWKPTVKPPSRTREDIGTEGGGGMIGETAAGVGSCGAVGGPV